MKRKPIEYLGVSYPHAAELYRKCCTNPDITVGMVRGRLASGWSTEDALSKGRGFNGGREAWARGDTRKSARTFLITPMPFMPPWDKVDCLIVDALPRGGYTL